MCGGSVSGSATGVRDCRPWLVFDLPEGRFLPHGQVEIFVEAHVIEAAPFEQAERGIPTMKLVKGHRSAQADVRAQRVNERRMKGRAGRDLAARLGDRFPEKELGMHCVAEL